MYEFLSFWNIIYTVIIIYSPIQWYRGFYGSVYSRVSSISNNCRRHIFNNHGTIGSDYVDTCIVVVLLQIYVLYNTRSGRLFYLFNI
jgi:hypothetical protein